MGLVLLAGLVRADEGIAAGRASAIGVSKLSDEGFTLYKARDYRHASEKFLQAYALDPDPNLLFNIARCYESLDDLDAAIEKYESFVATPDADPQGKRRATDALRSLRQARGAAARGASPSTSRAVPQAPIQSYVGELSVTGKGHLAGTSAGDRYAQLSTEGLALYRGHEYRRAAEKFVQAYAFDPDPNLLFNLARCYAALGDSSLAIEKYEVYLKASGTDAKGREQAKKAVASLRQVKADSSAAVVTAPADSASSPERAERSHNGRMVAGWIATGVLAAATVATGVLALESASKLDAARQTFPGDGTDISSRASRTTMLTVSADGLGIATLVMGSLSLYWTLSGPSSSTELRAAVGPTSVKISGSF